MDDYFRLPAIRMQFLALHSDVKFRVTAPLGFLRPDATMDATAF